MRTNSDIDDGIHINHKKSLGNVRNFKLKDYIFINKFQRVSLNLSIVSYL
jgi:hypothetical protein